jgi:hypothetical protein
MLGRSVVFLTADNIEAVLHTTPFAGTAWTLANLYLLSLGAEPLSDDAPDADHRELSPRRRSFRMAA